MSFDAIDFDSWGAEEKEEEEKKEVKKEVKKEKPPVKKTTPKKTTKTSAKTTTKKSTPKKATPKKTTPKSTATKKTTTRTTRKTPDHAIIKKIKDLESTKDQKIDELIEKEFKKAQLSKIITLDSQKVFDEIQDKAYFRFTYSGKNMRFSYSQWKNEFSTYSGRNKHFKLHKTEFVQFLTNYYKAHWIKKNWKNLTNQEFLMLKQSYRSKKLIEDILKQVNTRYFEIIEQNSLTEFIKSMRMIMGSAIKNEFLKA